MSFWQLLVLGIWIMIGVYRYISWEGSDGMGVDPELKGYSWYTILVHGPFWWFLKACTTFVDLYKKRKGWKWFENIFKIEKKGE